MSRRTQKPKRDPVPQIPPPGRKIPHVAFFIVAGALAVLAALIFLQRPDPSVAGEKGKDEAIASGESTRRSATAVVAAGSEKESISPGTQDSGQPATTETVTPAATPQPEPEPEQNAKIGHHIDDFRAYRTDLAEYKLDGVVLTNDGLQLAAKDDPETSRTEDGFRRGVLESPILPMGHASNAIQPIWRARIPNSENSLRVEVALSGDGQEWSQWYQIEGTGDDIEPYYPDGSPNPNYGAVSGNIVSNGLRLFPFFRYRVTLASTEEQSSPVLEEFKVTYVDSTLGQGFLHGVETPPQSNSATPQAP